MEENGSSERSVEVWRTVSVPDLRRQLVALLPRLRRFARALARNAADADDLVQLALERALARAGQARADSDLGGWMYGILRNAWIDELRSRGRRARLFAPAEAARHEGDDSQPRQAELLSVQEALARLPQEQRIVAGADRGALLQGGGAHHAGTDRDPDQSPGARARSAAEDVGR